MLSNLRRAPMRRLIPITAALSALSLSACAGAPSAQIKVPATFRQACVGPTSPMRTAGDRDALLVRYEASLGACDAKRAGAVNLIDAAAPKRPWWDFRKPDS